MVFVRGLISKNSVPAIFNRKDSWGTVVLVDSQLEGGSGADDRPAILNQRQLYVRNVTAEGYGKAIDNADKGRDKGDVPAMGNITTTGGTCIATPPV